MICPLIIGLYGLSKNKESISGYSVIKTEEAIEILSRAWKLGIRYIDTASTYGDGNSDLIIKKLRGDGCTFKLFSKIGLDVSSNQFNSNRCFLKNEILKLKSLHGEFIYSVLLHSPDADFLSKENYFSDFVNDVKSIIGEHVKIGISLRSPDDYLFIKNFHESLIVEANISWFDLRILKYIPFDSLQKHSFLARSIYASGLINLICQDNFSLKSSFEKSDVRSTWDIETLLKRNQNDVKRLQKVKNTISKESISDISFSLFPLLSNILDGLIIGPLSMEELLDSIKSYNTFKNISPDIKLRKIVNESINEFKNI